MIYLLIPILIVCCVFFIPRAWTAKDTPNQMEELKHRRRRKKRIAMIIFLLFIFLYVTFAILDAMVLKLSGYLGTWDAIGKREIVIGNLDYAVSPDRTEIVLNYDLVTKYYDSWAATTPDGRPVPSRSSSVPAETRILWTRCRTSSRSVSFRSNMIPARLKASEAGVSITGIRAGLVTPTEFRGRCCRFARICIWWEKGTRSAFRARFGILCRTDWSTPWSFARKTSRCFPGALRVRKRLRTQSS